MRGVRVKRGRGVSDNSGGGNNVIVFGGEGVNVEW